MSFSLLCGAAEMCVVDLICLGDHLLVEALGFSRLVTADEQNRYSRRVKGKKDAHRSRNA
jgi:hypothetical protein